MKGRPVLILFVGCLLWLAAAIPDPGQVLFWRGGAFSDLLISHWPNAAFLQRSLLEWGQVPLWNPMILSGAPFFADPLSGLFYPPIWLASVFAPTFAFNLLFYLHLAWAGIGTWRLARRIGMSDLAAIAAGLAFSGAPKLIGHIGLGHVTLVFAVCWTPWVLLAVDSAARQSGAAALLRVRSAALAGAATALVFLIDPRWFPYILLLCIPFAAWTAARSHRSDGPSKWGKWFGSLGVTGLATIGIAAMLALPLAEFLRLTSRAGMSSAEANEFALPLSKLLSLLAPELAGWPEWQAYSGATVAFLAMVALVFDGRRSAFWGVAAGAMLLLGLGSGSPLFPLLRTVVPGLAQLRVPARSLFLSAFAFSILAGYGLDRIISGGIATMRVLRLGVVIGIGILVSGWAAASQAAPGTGLTIWLPHLVAVWLVGLAVGWTGVSRQGGARAWAGWVLLILLDLGLVSLATLQARPGVGGPDPRTRAIAAQIEASPPSRVYSPSYGLPQPSASLLGLESADGVNPLQLASYVEFMSEATGIPSHGYSVTLPAYPQGRPELSRTVRLDSEKLGLLSIAEVVSAYPVEPGGFDSAGRLDGQYRYTNPEARPRAWIETSASPGWRAISTEVWTPNHIRITAEGPGRLVLSELAYPGWWVDVDGEPAELQVASGLFRAVDLPTGEHEILFALRPASLLAGLAITLITGLALASLWFHR